MVSEGSGRWCSSVDPTAVPLVGGLREPRGIHRPSDWSKGTKNTTMSRGSRGNKVVDAESDGVVTTSSAGETTREEEKERDDDSFRQGERSLHGIWDCVMKLFGTKG